MSKKNTFITSLGAGLEYYDFIIYGMMAPYLSTLFFEESSSFVNLIKTFAIFAVGYLIRPFGGLLFGLLGDTQGRRKTLLNVMFLMGLSTFFIGMLPTYAQIGIFAPLTLLFMRLIQGASFGAELPGAITLICEHARHQEHGNQTGIVISSVSIGSSLAALILYLMNTLFSNEQMLAFGWRIPFLLGGILAIVNLYIRKHLQETPDFIFLQYNEKDRSPKKTFYNLVKNFNKEVVLGICINLFSASLVIFALYLPTYLSFFAYDNQSIYLAMSFGTLWSALILPSCGKLADKIGRGKMISFACLAGLLLFNMLEINGIFGLFLFITLFQTVISFLVVSCMPILTSLFPAKVRYTGVGVCYNVSFSIMGIAPLFLTSLIEVTHKPQIGIWFLMLTAVVSLISASILSRKYVYT